MATKALQQYYGTGRRKTSVARVYLREGSGKFIINGKAANDYLCLPTLIMHAFEPLEILQLNHKKFDIKINTAGGGTTGQAGAVRLGLSRALVQYSEAHAPEQSTLIEAFKAHFGEIEATSADENNAEVVPLTAKMILRKSGCLTRDDREVERKKTGQPKARKRSQYSKR